MTNTVEIRPESDFSRNIYKRLTLILFFLLPVRLSKVFVNLSIVMLVFNVRRQVIQHDDLTMKRLSHMLKIHLDDSVLMLPGKTCQWYWPDEVLDKAIAVGERTLTLRTMIQNNAEFIKHRGLIVNTLIDYLPKSLNFKLKLGELQNRLLLKHNITNAILRS